MPEIIFSGPAGRLEGRYQPGKTETAPVALILHPHPQYGGTMDNKVTYYLYHAFAHRGFATLRFNFRGVGRSQGEFDNGTGELSDAAAALDWLQSMNENSTGTWIAGFSFGAWIGMQLLMRRPEIKGFISVAPPANLYDFSFLAPCPSSGLIIQADQDDLVTPISVQKLVEKLKAQKSITIHHDNIKGANHFFESELNQLMTSVNNYLNMRLTSGD
ncbi:alpha/beta hydrolase [Kordiimonas lipolytica]|uniref:Alpha/beta hydrolase n=1 Tax=Kordiimonas lipolytica TaxID=1662421 RepID=A0ABV8UCC9_9PROT|nr:alpha/beta hydrolase [Kordiimonas lipolytica]